MKIEITIQNIEKLTRAFEAAPAAVERRLAASLGKVARAIQETARANHRFKSRSGDLERSIDYTVNRGEMKAEVGILDDTPEYGKWVHNGTPPHKIRPSKRKSLRFVGDADIFSGSGGQYGFVFAKSVNHPGTKADPFVHNAATKVDADAIFNEGVNAAIQEVFK